MSFDISLPGLYKESWREAYRADREDVPRLSSYQAPGCEPVTFIYKNLEFTGGQAVETAEYPFYGLWSNETLNHKPQIINVNGFLRGERYLKQRAAFANALLIPTSDDQPGFFDHPLWGRFKVIVENYNIQESADENGQCEISLTLKRAGVSLEKRAAALARTDFIKPKEVALIAAEEFARTEANNINETALTEINTATLLQSFGSIKAILSKGIGGIRAAQTILNTVTNELNGVTNLIDQGIKEPMALARTMINSIFSIVGTVLSVSDSAEAVIDYFFKFDNKKNLMMMFLSFFNLRIPVDTVTVNQAKTKILIENFFRTVSLCASAELMTRIDDINLKEINGYWSLYANLENEINLENPDLYKAVVEMRATLSQTLKRKTIRDELQKNIIKPVSLLSLSHYLGCGDEKIWAMNLIEDSLLISGEVSYV